MAFTVLRGTITGTTQVSLGTPAANSEYRIKNLGPDAPLFIGPTGVTPNNGHPIEPCESFVLPAGAGGADEIFGCTMAGRSVQFSIATDV